jgi:hypothetical protein
LKLGRGDNRDDYAVNDQVKIRRLKPRKNGGVHDR